MIKIIKYFILFLLAFLWVGTTDQGSSIAINCPVEESGFDDSYQVQTAPFVAVGVADLSGFSLLHQIAGKERVARQLTIEYLSNVRGLLRGLSKRSGSLVRLAEYQVCAPSSTCYSYACDYYIFALRRILI